MWQVYTLIIIIIIISLALISVVVASEFLSNNNTNNNAKRWVSYAWCRCEMRSLCATQSSRRSTDKTLNGHLLIYRLFLGTSVVNRGGGRGAVALGLSRRGGTKQSHQKYFNDHKSEFDEVTAEWAYSGLSQQTIAIFVAGLFNH